MNKLPARTSLLLILILLVFFLSCSRNSSQPFTVVSIPDFLNVDTDFPQEGWEESLDVFLQAVKAENPDLVLIPGDLVMGHWDMAEEGIDFWADRYYSEWKERMDAYGFTYLVTVGDHELGDNDWPPQKASKVPDFKNAFTRNFKTPDNGPGSYKGTTYFYTLNNVLFIMLDCYRVNLQAGQETCEATIDEEQLSWLEKVINEHSEVDYIVVSGHVPVIAPVRKLSSSGMILQEKENSPFWQLMKKSKVDFYLCGEVHDVTTYFDEPVIQISHGGLFGYNDRVNYMVMKFHGNEVHCQVKEFGLECSGERLWQTGNNRPFKSVIIQKEPEIRGELTLVKTKNATEVILEKGILSHEENTPERIAEDQEKNIEYTLKTHNYRMPPG